MYVTIGCQYQIHFSVLGLVTNGPKNKHKGNNLLEFGKENNNADDSGISTFAERKETEIEVGESHCLSWKSEVDRFSLESLNNSTKGWGVWSMFGCISLKWARLHPVLYLITFVLFLFISWLRLVFPRL